MSASGSPRPTGRWRASAGPIARSSAAAGARSPRRPAFDELNELIRQHNEWYPIERDLPMDPRTRDYVLIRGRSYRRPELGPEWVLEQFPSGPA